MNYLNSNLISGIIKATEKVCLSCRIFTLGFKDIFSPVPVGIEFLDLRHHFLEMPNPLAVIFMIGKIILLAIHGAIFGKSTSAARHQITVLRFLAITTKWAFKGQLKSKCLFWCLQFIQKMNLKTLIFALAYLGRHFSCD